MYVLIDIIRLYDVDVSDVWLYDGAYTYLIHDSSTTLFTDYLYMF